MEITVAILNSFTCGNLGGNPAGVVVDADSLSDLQMQSIATQLGLSETAFVQSSHTADYRVRFFTPQTEIDLCGHATIATFAFLHFTKRLNSGKYTQETKAGILEIEILENGLVFMEQVLPIFSASVERSRVAKVLEIPESWMTNHPQIISTGVNDLFVELDTRHHLFSIQPNSKAIAQFSEEIDCIGIHAFTLDKVNPKSVAHSRNFAPRVGIDEESATGTSNGALACYLFENHKLDLTHGNHFILEQGYSMNSPSEIHAKLLTKSGKIDRVQIGGYARVSGQDKIKIV
jgi:PhzF family phenazine biosynthesis protein